MQPRGKSRSLAGLALPFCLSIAPIMIHAQVVITSGGAETYWNPPPGPAGGGQIYLAGPDFSLSSTVLLNGGGAVPIQQSPSQVQMKFNPSQSATLDLVPFTPLPSSVTSVTYQGVSYVASGMSMKFSADPVTVNIPAIQVGGLFGSISNVPFTMTGTVTMCPSGQYAPPAAFPCDATNEITISFSGSGIYSSNLTGSISSRPSGIGNYQFTPPSGFALDTVTQGNWNGAYGFDGYLLPNGAKYLPPYAAVGFQPNYPYTWLGPGQINDARALQDTACPIQEYGVVCNPDRIASAFTWYGTNSVNISITFTDSLTHRVALYLLDWDSYGRQETVSIQQNGQLFDTQTFSNFHNGQWASWNLQGNILISVTPVGAPSATNPGSPVVSGIFFGPGVSSNSVPNLAPNVQPASYAFEYPLAADTKTLGFWTGTYGANGYLIANGNSKAPTYGTVSQTGGTTFTWAAGTNDRRALQTSPGSTSRIASAFTQYGAQPLSFNVNITDTVAHSVSLYLLDWDSSGRQETITFQDVATGAILFSETYSHFGGEYLTWLISGNVTITVTPIGPASSTNPDTAVVSGIFFN